MGAVSVLLPLLDLSVYALPGNGFAASIVGAFFGLGILVLFMMWISKKPGPPGSGPES